MNIEETTGGMERLDPRYVSAQRMLGWAMAVIVMGAWAVVLGVLLWIGEEGLRGVLRLVLAIGAVLAPLLIWLATAWPALQYRHTAYRVGSDRLEIQHGVIVRRLTWVPRSRVQHTDVAQGPFDRRFGLGTLVIYTAGTEHARVALPGLAHATATAIRDQLLPKDGADAI